MRSMNTKDISTFDVGLFSFYQVNLLCFLLSSLHLNFVFGLFRNEMSFYWSKYEYTVLQ